MFDAEQVQSAFDAAIAGDRARAAFASSTRILSGLASPGAICGDGERQSVLAQR